MKAVSKERILLTFCLDKKTDRCEATPNVEIPASPKAENATLARKKNKCLSVPAKYHRGFSFI